MPLYPFPFPSLGSKIPNVGQKSLLWGFAVYFYFIKCDISNILSYGQEDILGFTVAASSYLF